MSRLHSIGKKGQRDRDRLRRFLPTTREEMEARGWEELDILIVNGDCSPVAVEDASFGAVKSLYR